MIELLNRRESNTKSYDLGRGRIITNIHIGDIHYKDNYNDPTEQWKDTELTWKDGRITKAPYELTYSNNEIRLKDKKSGAITVIELLTIGGTSLSQRKAEVSNNTIVMRDVAVDTDIEIIAEFTAVKFRRILKSSKAPSEARFKITGDKSKVISLAFDGDGNVPIKVTTKGDIVTETLDPDKALKYPVKVDPTWLVGDSTDDCYRRLTTSAFSLVEVACWAGYAAAAAKQYGSGMRYTNVTITQNAIIDSAYLTLRAYNSKGGTAVNTRISAEAVDNPSTFLNDAAAFDTRWANRTSTVDWNNMPAFTLGDDYDSPDIKTVIQEIVDRPGWSSGNAIVIFWEDFEDRSTHASDCFRGAVSYNGDSEHPIMLTVDWHEAGPSGVTVSKVGKVSVSEISKINKVALADIKKINKVTL